MLFALATTPLELMSFVLAMITVWLNIRQNHWAWLFAIISSASYAIVFFGASLYGDTGLQLVFIALSIWGWRQWLRAGTDGASDSGKSADNSADKSADKSADNDAGARLQVSRLSRRGWCVAIAGWLAGYLILAWFLRSQTDSDVPHADAFLTAGSLLGQWLLARKKLENWYVWIIVDVLYVGLYLYKDLMLTAVLYAIFIVMALAGLRLWSLSMKRASA
jgi:nicotinamide mononucleotide transporter